MRPGITYEPSRSISLPPSARAGLLESSIGTPGKPTLRIFTMRLFSMTISTGPMGGEPVPSMSVAPRRMSWAKGPSPSTRSGASGAGSAAGAAFLVRRFCGRGDESWISAAVVVVSLLVAAFCFSGHFNNYGDVRFTAFAWLMAAPLGLWGGWLVSARRPRSWPAFCCGFFPVVAACAVSLHSAWPALTASGY